MYAFTISKQGACVKNKGGILSLRVNGINCGVVLIPVWEVFPPFIKLELPYLKSYHTIIPYHVMSYTILSFCIQEHINTPGSVPTA
jgi:hypothetical protein